MAFNLHKATMDYWRLSRAFHGAPGAEVVQVGTALQELTKHVNTMNPARRLYKHTAILSHSIIVGEIQCHDPNNCTLIPLMKG